MKLREIIDEKYLEPIREYEIWHKSFGDQMWSELLNKEFAIYGSSELE